MPLSDWPQTVIIFVIQHHSNAIILNGIYDINFSVCMVDENGVSHAPECQVATDDSECANDDDPEGFIYSIDT